MCLFFHGCPIHLFSSSDFDTCVTEFTGSFKLIGLPSVFVLMGFLLFLTAVCFLFVLFFVFCVCVFVCVWIDTNL